MVSIIIPIGIWLNHFTQPEQPTILKEWVCHHCKTTNMLDLPYCQACFYPKEVKPVKGNIGPMEVIAWVGFAILLSAVLMVIVHNLRKPK